MKKWLRYILFGFLMLFVPSGIGALTQVFLHLAWIGVVIGVAIVIYIGMETSILDKDEK